MALRYYEGLWLFDSAVAAKDWEQLLAHVRGLIEKHGGKIIRLEKWDDRKLAYDVKNVKRGTYMLGHFQLEPTEVAPMKREFALSEYILRHILLEDEDLLAKIQERAELKKKREAEAAQAAAEGLPTEGDRDRRSYDRPRYRDRDRMPAPAARGEERGDDLG
jgi:small subunit ribosomal protein S6